jgi:class 3 adenylate cyclase
VLIVDDDQQIRNLAQTFLEHAGYTVVGQAADGQQGYELVCVLGPDIVLMDIDMPKVNGIEATRLIQENCPTPVVMVTSTVDKEIVDLASTVGAGAYLVKPFTPQELEPTITVALARFDDMRALRHLNQELVRLNNELQEREKALAAEKKKSESLLLNILPKPIAERLKQGADIIADDFPDITILFADLADFTHFSSQISSIELVNILNDVFSLFDHLAEKYNIEKIKTIGDAYMAVAGLPIPRLDHAEAIAELALDMQQAVEVLSRERNLPLSLRIGLNTGPVTAGVIGRKKFAYDIWGNAVNTASRMEAQGVAGKIQVTEVTYERLRDRYTFTERGWVEIKGRGQMKTYFLTGRRD